jgi:hypothetical protein
MHAAQYVAVTRSNEYLFSGLLFFTLFDRPSIPSIIVQLLLAVTFEIKQLHFKAHSFTSSAAAAATTIFAVLGFRGSSPLVSSPSLLTHHAALLR